MTFTYRVKARGLGPSRYELSYGRGNKRLTDVAETGRGQSWRIVGRDDLGTAPTLGRIRKRWGQWASHVYALHPACRTNIDGMVLEDTPEPMTTPPPPAPRVSLSPRRRAAPRTIGDPTNYGCFTDTGVSHQERDALLGPVGGAR